MALKRLPAAALLTALLVACRPATAPPPPPPTPSPAPSAPRVGLDDSLAPLGELSLAAYPDSDGLPQLVPGNAEALSSDLRAGLLDGLLQYTVPDAPEIWFTPVAVDGLVVFVHPDNSVHELTLSQVQAIYAGRLTNWSTVGGVDRPIALFGREERAGPRLLFRERVMAEQRVAITAQIQGSERAMKAAVAADPGAIGYGMMGDAGPNVATLLLEGVAANPTMTTSQTYPLSAPVYFVSLGEPTGLLRAWLAWLQSDAGQAALGGRYGRVR